jgi:outer membrane protein
MRKLIIALVFTFGIILAGNISAQSTIKLGHLNSQELLASMPETDSASKTLEARQVEMRKTLESLNVELNNKYEEYLKLANDATSSKLIVGTKQEEVTTLQSRIENFQTQAQQELESLNAELFKPIQEKAVKAISAVALDNGFTYIFDTNPGSGAVIYTSPDSQNILPLVKAKLGLK